MTLPGTIPGKRCGGRETERLSFRQLVKIAYRDTLLWCSTLAQELVRASALLCKGSMENKTGQSPSTSCRLWMAVLLPFPLLVKSKSISQVRLEFRGDSFFFFSCLVSRIAKTIYRVTPGREKDIAWQNPILAARDPNRF